MSSSFATIPKTAPFTEEDVALLNQVVGPASADQRAWLAGFLAGVESVQGAGAAQPAAPARPAEPITIVYASESGNCEKLANDFAKSARKNGLKPTLVDLADLELDTLVSAKKLIFIAATWGEGEPPARAVRGYGELMGEGTPRLDGVEFGVLALAEYRHRRSRNHRADKFEFVTFGQGNRASCARLREWHAGLSARRLARSICRERRGLCR